MFDSLPESFYQNILQLHQLGEWKPIIVHGGGPMITTLLTKLGIQTQFVNGLRVTTNEVLDVVEMVLSGSINKQLVGKLHKLGGKAVGLSGVDAGLLQAQPTENADVLGYVGDVSAVNDTLLMNLLTEGYIPVISPLAIDEQGQRYNINGDMAAAAIAKSLQAKLCFISDIPGVYVEEGDERIVLHRLSHTQVEEMIRDQKITGGMIPKVKAALDGLSNHIPEVVILNGLEPNVLIDFCEGEEVGTKFYQEELEHHV